MIETVLPDLSTRFGQRVERRLNEEIVIWMTTVGSDGTPQPNPVWFIWENGSILVYNRPSAARVAHVRIRPRVSMNFDGNGKGGDIVVLTGTATISHDPPPDRYPDYVSKYEQNMTRVSGTLAGFAEAYPVPIRVQVTRIRGF